MVAYNSAPFLEACLNSLAAQTHPDTEVIVVDNGSTDGGPEYVERVHPAVRVIRTGANLGYAGGNNRGVAAATGEVVAILNPDTEVEPDWLAALLAALATGDEVGLVTSRICLHGSREVLNTCGNDIHVTGLGFCRGLLRPASEFDHPTQVAAISGCAFAVRRELLLELGAFDEDFFAYVEDTDLSIRAALAGHRVVYVPSSRLHHHYELRMRPDKFFLLERNRQLMLLKNLRSGTLLAMLPVLLLGEVMTWTFAAIRGRPYLAAKFGAARWLFTNRRSIAAKRRRLRKLRRVGDGAILDLMTVRLPAGQTGVSGPLERPLNSLADALFWVLMLPARVFIR